MVWLVGALLFNISKWGQSIHSRQWYRALLLSTLSTQIMQASYTRSLLPSVKSGSPTSTCGTTTILPQCDFVGCTVVAVKDCLNLPMCTNADLQYLQLLCTNVHDEGRTALRLSGERDRFVGMRAWRHADHLLKPVKPLHHASCRSERPVLEIIPSFKLRMRGVTTQHPGPS